MRQNNLARNTPNIIVISSDSESDEEEEEEALSRTIENEPGELREMGNFPKAFLEYTDSLRKVDSLKLEDRERYKHLIRQAEDAEVRGDLACAEHCYMDCIQLYDGDDALTMRILALCLKNGVARAEDFANEAQAGISQGGVRRSTEDNLNEVIVIE